MTIAIEEGLVHLERAGEILRPYMPDAVATVDETVERVRGRAQVGGRNAVVALAGATGSGKSSLLNALTGEDVAKVAPIRPTTSEPLAVSGSSAAEVLDWMGVRSRKVLPGALGDDDVVMLDLPDFDSIEVEHRRLADSLIERSDVVIFVLDPQKYADAVVHKDYLEAFVEHGAVCLVVLNQIDRLSAGEREGVVGDVSRLLSRDGVDVPVLVTSTRTGEGVSDVRDAILDLVSRRDAARAKLAAELRSAAAGLAHAVREDGGRDPLDASTGDFSEAAQAIAVASGAKEVSQAAAQSYSVRARRASAWPASRWVRRGLDPLVRLGLVDASRDGESPERVGNLVAGSSSVARSAVRRYVEDRLSILPESWRSSAVEGSTGFTEDLIENADEFMSEVDLEYKRHPKWWTVVGVTQIFLFAAVLLSFFWLIVVNVAKFLQIRLPDPMYIGPISFPAFLLVGGLLSGWGLSILSRSWRIRGSERVRARVEGRLGGVVRERAMQSILEPIEAERERYDDYVERIRKLSAVG